MNITRDQLTDADFETLFTRDPGNFIEAVIVNIMWAKGAANEGELLSKQRFIFEQWLAYYTRTVQGEQSRSIFCGTMSQAEAFRAGQIDALCNLPIKKGLLHRTVDLHEVAQRIKDLKYLASGNEVINNKTVGVRDHERN